MTTGLVGEGAQRYDVLIIGAQVASALRHSKLVGSIRLLGDEPDLCYERPPLFKDYLSGERPIHRLLLQAADFQTENNMAMLIGRRVTKIYPSKRHVVCADGKVFGYGTLVWAAGGSARRLVCAGRDLVSVHALRTCADADRLRAEPDAAHRVVVIGDGYGRQRRSSRCPMPNQPAGRLRDRRLRASCQPLGRRCIDPPGVCTKFKRSGRRRGQGLDWRSLCLRRRALVLVAPIRSQVADDWAFDRA